MTERSIVVVSAGLSQPSSTRLLADRLATATDRALRLRGEAARVHVVELREVAHDITDALLTGFPGDELSHAVDLVQDADGLVAVTPIFSASYSGLFKAFFDVLDEGALEGKPVLVAATGGTARHSLALDFAVRPLMTYLRATVVPTAVFAATEDFGRVDGAASLKQRVEQAARELSDLVGTGRSTARVDTFDNPTPFEQLLAGR